MPDIDYRLALAKRLCRGTDTDRALFALIEVIDELQAKVATLEQRCHYLENPFGSPLGRAPELQPKRGPIGVIPPSLVTGPTTQDPEIEP